MRATVMYSASAVQIENVPDAALMTPSDAVIRITRACTRLLCIAKNTPAGWQ